MTRSGCLFTPLELRNEENQGRKAKEEVTTEQAKVFLKGKAPQIDKMSRKMEKGKYLMRKQASS